MSQETTEVGYDHRAVIAEAILKRVETTLAGRSEDEVTQQARNLVAELKQGSARGLGVHFERGFGGKQGEESLGQGRFFIGTENRTGEFGFQDIAGQHGRIPQEELNLRQELSSVNYGLTGDTSVELLQNLRQEHPMETTSFLKEEVAREIEQVDGWLKQIKDAIGKGSGFEDRMASGYKPEILEKRLQLLHEFEQQL